MSIYKDKEYPLTVIVNFNTLILVFHTFELDIVKMLWSSGVKLAKKFNSTSFNLKQEVFIRRDKDWPEEGWYLYRTWFDTLKITRWTVNFNIHTSFGGWLMCDQGQCRCEVAFAIKSEVWWHIFTPWWLIVRWKGMTLLNSCQVIKSWPIWIYWVSFLPCKLYLSVWVFV